MSELQKTLLSRLHGRLRSERIDAIGDGMPRQIIGMLEDTIDEIDQLLEKPEPVKVAGMSIALRFWLRQLQAARKCFYIYLPDRPHYRACACSPFDSNPQLSIAEVSNDDPAPNAPAA